MGGLSADGKGKISESKTFDSYDGEDINKADRNPSNLLDDELAKMMVQSPSPDSLTEDMKPNKSLYEGFLESTRKENSNKSEKTLYEGFMERNNAGSDECSTPTAVESRPSTKDSNKGLDLQKSNSSYNYNYNYTDSPTRSAQIFTANTLKALEDEMKINEKNLDNLDSLKVNDHAKDLAKEKLLEERAYLLSQHSNHMSALLQKASRTSTEESAVDLDKLIEDSTKLKDNINKLIDDTSSLSHRKLNKTNEGDSTNK
jgi:hypothetical protein